MFDHKIKKTKKLHLVQKEHICNKKTYCRLYTVRCAIKNLRNCC